MLGAGGLTGCTQPGPGWTQLPTARLLSLDAFMGQKPLFHSPSSRVVAHGSITADHSVAWDKDGDLKDRRCHH